MGDEASWGNIVGTEVDARAHVRGVCERRAFDDAEKRALSGTLEVRRKAALFLLSKNDGDCAIQYAGLWNPSPSAAIYCDDQQTVRERAKLAE
jgi:hypothetical protein